MKQFYVMVTILFKIYTNQHMWDSGFKGYHYGPTSSEYIDNSKYINHLAAMFNVSEIPSWIFDIIRVATTMGVHLILSL